MNKTLLLTALLSLTLSGCQTTYTRADADKFKSIFASVIPKSSVPAFADCVMDGFESGQPFLANTNVRQQRRSTGLRIESHAGSGSNSILMSADVHDDGRVQLWESDAALLISTTGVRNAFARCLSNVKADAT